MYRLFIALDMPAETKQRIATISCGIPGARWIDPSQLHLTLRFIGNVDGGQFQEIGDALDELRLPPIDLTLEGLGFFKRGKQLTSLWIRVQESKDLGRLRHRIDRCLVDLELAIENRKFSPHVTLARLKQAHPDRSRRFLSDHALFTSPTVTIDMFHLFSSTLTAKGAIYTIERSYPLTTSERERLQMIIASDDLDY